MDHTTNRITTAGYTYDAAGNMTNDAIHAYTFDAENRLITVDAGQANNTTYSYDGKGLRVKKAVTAGSTTTTTVYVFSGSKTIAEFVGGTLGNEYIYVDGELLATITSGGAVKYRHTDDLTGRLETDATGAATRTFGQLPFGETWYETGTASKWKFNSYERDSESSLDYATFRYDASRLGRFMTPDPIGGPAGDPQSLNRYAYVGNDPLNVVDPLGLSGEPPVRGVCLTPEFDFEVCKGGGSSGQGGSSGGRVVLSGPGGCAFYQLHQVETAGGAYYYYEGFFCGGGEGRGGGVNNGGVHIGGAANNRPKQTKQQCIQNALQNKFGNFVANKVIPEFSLLSLADNWRAFAKGSAISTGVKLSTWGTALAYGKIMTATGTNLAQYPGMAVASADALEAGAFWTTTAATGGTILAGGVAAVSAFSTGADYWARQQCKDVQ
jgi:RHS repeat-associated protein